MLRLAVVLIPLAMVTLALIPLQWLAVTFGWGLRRRIPVFYHRLICRLIGLRVSVIGARRRQHPLLIVSNHASWLDISVITSVASVVFVAKQEVSTWPIFGLLAKLQRTVFVDRNRRSSTQAVNAEIAARLAEGDPVVLFGEGTSSDGNRVLTFRSALIGSCRDALAEAEHTDRVWIQPLSVAYTGVLGLPLGRRHRPWVAWYGAMDLLPHLAGVIRRGAIDVTLRWGEPVAFDQMSDRKAVTKELELAVRSMTAATLRGREATGPADRSWSPIGRPNVQTPASPPGAASC